MTAQPAEAVLAACKRQIDVALQITEAMVEAAEKAREIQLAAAVDAHAALEATRKSLESATTLPELMAMQSRLATENVGKMFGYWTSLAGTAGEIQARLAGILPGAKAPQKAA
jgi:hypothetical protein